MPNYARQSSLDLDEMFGNYIKNDSNAAMMRNIRTKERMNSAHHCEDKECSGSPTMRCVSALHFCWCLAPVVDEDKKSNTYGQVVICGQRFQCILPKGCAVHTYLAGFNLDIKNARNNYPATEVEWKAIFEAYKAKHDAALANKAERQELSRKRAGMTEHQYRRQLKLQDQAAFQKRREQELAADRQDTGQEIGRRPPFTIVAGPGLGGLSSRGQDSSMAKNRDIVGVAADSSGLQVVYRAPSTRVSVRLTCAVKDGHRPITPVPGDRFESTLSGNYLQGVPSTEVTSTLGTSPLANLPLTKHSEPLSAPTDDGEVADKQAPIETLATRLRRKDAKEAKRQRASEVRANAMAEAALKANKEEDTREIAKEEDVIMSEMRPRGGKGVRGGKTGVSGKTVLRGKTGGYTFL